MGPWYNIKELSTSISFFCRIIICLHCSYNLRNRIFKNTGQASHHEHTLLHRQKNSGAFIEPGVEMQKGAGVYAHSTITRYVGKHW